MNYIIEKYLSAWKKRWRRAVTKTCKIISMESICCLFLQKNANGRKDKNWEAGSKHGRENSPCGELWSFLLTASTVTAKSLPTFSVKEDFLRAIKQKKPKSLEVFQQQLLRRLKELSGPVQQCSLILHAFFPTWSSAVVRKALGVGF